MPCPPGKARKSEPGTHHGRERRSETDGSRGYRDDAGVMTLAMTDRGDAAGTDERRLNSAKYTSATIPRQHRSRKSQVNSAVAYEAPEGRRNQSPLIVVSRESPGMVRKWTEYGLAGKAPRLQRPLAPHCTLPPVWTFEIKCATRASHRDSRHRAPRRCPIGSVYDRA